MTLVPASPTRVRCRRPRHFCRLRSSVFSFVRALAEHLRSGIGSGWIMRRHEPAVRWSVRSRPAGTRRDRALVLSAIPGWYLLGTELLPSVDERVLLYMPSTVPGIPIAEAERLLTQTDRILKAFPEVERVLGKAGRADTATDPAPLSMLETTVVLRPRSQWPRVATWYSPWAPEWLKPAFRLLTPDTPSLDAVVAAMNDALVVPGVANAWSMPIRGRIDMLNSGVRTPVALRISGSRIEEIERLETEIEAVLSGVTGIRSAFAERSTRDVPPTSSGTARPWRAPAWIRRCPDSD